MALAFDGVAKEITITTDTTLNVLDLWSRWVDWWLTSDNSKFGLAMEQVGGNDIDIGAGTAIPIYIFLKDGWKVRPKEADHTLAVTAGILLVDGGGDPFLDTTGAYTVRVNYQQPVQAITVSTGGGSAPTVSQIWSHAIESGFTAEEILRILAAASAGKTSGQPTNPVFRDIGDTKDRITGTVDSNGNRTSVTLDET